MLDTEVVPWMAFVSVMQNTQVPTVPLSNARQELLGPVPRRRQIRFMSTLNVRIEVNVILKPVFVTAISVFKAPPVNDVGTLSFFPLRN